jgi:uncharacterized protein (TIGR02677 family)
MSHPLRTIVLVAENPDDEPHHGGPAAQSTEAEGSPYRVFAYVLGERAELYLDVVDALVAAKDRFRLQLRPGEVVRELTSAGRHHPEDDVRSSLEALAEWGNVSRFYDSVAPETLAEFYGKRFLYQLTPEGAAAHDGVQAARRVGLDGGGRLSAVLLPAIVEHLEAGRAEALEADPDPARLHNLLVGLFATFTELADNAARYMSDLAVETIEVAADQESFVAYKRAVFAYLNTFVARFTELVPVIAALVSELDAGMPGLLALAAAEDVAPSATGDDEGPLAVFERRWRGVRAWFVTDAEQVPTAESLRVAMLDALNRILVAVTRINERHLRRASREADFDALARWFAAADDGDDPHRLWDATFGAFPSRHFTDPSGDEEIDRRRSFWEATPADVAPRLRAAGVRASPGRPGPVPDYSAAKSAAVAAVRAARARAAAAAERLAARTPVRLSSLGQVDAAEFEQLLAVLAAGLAARPGPDDSRQAMTPFGRVVLCPGDDAATAAVTTPTGTFHAPDLLLDLQSTAGAPGAKAEVDPEKAAG